MIEETAQSYTAALYEDVMAVLDSREVVSNTRDRLTAYFTAKGVDVTEPDAAVSEIYLGGDLCN